MTIFQILNAVKNEPSTNNKILLLNKHKNDALLRQVISMAYDRNTYVWGCTLPQVLKASYLYKIADQFDKVDLKFVLDWMCTDLNKKVTGNAAKGTLKYFIDCLSDEESRLIQDIIRHDLRLGMNVKTINKALDNIIPVIEYMRCDIFTEKHKIKFPAYLQVKADGTWRELHVNSDGSVKMFTRQGKPYKNPVLAEAFKTAPAGRYIGELTVPGMNRVQGNGYINSDNPDYNKIVFTLWDYVSDNTELYFHRFEKLQRYMPVHDCVKLIETRIVENNAEVMKFTKEWIERGEEGAVLKDFFACFKNGTSKLQLKIKPTAEIDVRVVGFTKGSMRTARENKIGAIIFKTDDGKIVGQTSGFNQSMLDELTVHADEYIGKIMTVECNGLQLADGAQEYHLMHPRFIEFRDDKSETDNLKRVEKMFKTFS